MGRHSAAARQLADSTHDRRAADGGPGLSHRHASAGPLDRVQRTRRRAGSGASGPVGYLRDIHPLLHLVAASRFTWRRTKKSPERPFAFIATYSHKLSDQAKVQHLPLAEAAQDVCGNEDVAKLEMLLEPVRRAAEKKRVVRKAAESRALFAPQAWTIPQAYAFLKDVAAMGRPASWCVPVVVGARPARPVVQVHLGAPGVGAFADHLLGFDIGLALEGGLSRPRRSKFARK